MRRRMAIDLRDPLVFYDTSSFRTDAVEATARQVGAGRLVYGSDRPVAEPAATGLEPSLMRNAARLLNSVQSLAA